MSYYYNPRDEKCKKPFGALTNGEEIEITLYAENGVYIHSAFFTLKKDGGLPIYYQMAFGGFSGSSSVFKLAFKVPDPGLYWYSFKIITEHSEINLKRGEDGNAAASGAEDYVLFVADKKFKTPDWIKGGIIYHIFVDRFNKGSDEKAIFDKKGVLKNWNEPITVRDPDGVFRANDFYGGNLQGIIDKLDYLEELGATLLYLSPIFESASNHRYDTGNYLKIDKLLGDEEKFAELIKKAEKKGIYIMLDGVFNHTGADSVYFNKFGNYPGLGAYQSKQSKYFDWYYFNEFPDNYRCWWGVTVSPTVNKQNPAYRELILGQGGVIDKYTKLGVKGWRLDVVDELDVDFVHGIREAVKAADKEAVIIGEVWEDASTKISYDVRRPYFVGDQLDGVMNYPFKGALLDFAKGGGVFALREAVLKILENYPRPALDVCMNLAGTHDTMRLLNVLNFDPARVKIAAALEFFLPGVPSIYYGDEAGLDGEADPLNRKPMPWGNFNAEIFEFYKQLAKIRKENKSLFAGGFNFGQEEDLLVIERRQKSKVIALIANNTAEAKHIRIPENGTELLSNTPVKKGITEIKPCGVQIIG